MLTDRSAAQPCSDAKESQAPQEQPDGDNDSNVELEYDIALHLPPKRTYTVELEITSVERAKPLIVEPEMF